MSRILALGFVLAAVLAGPAEAAPARFLVVVDLDLRISDLDDLSSQGAVGLLVPDAGPETSEERARAALVSGAVRNSLLGDEPPGRPLIDLLSPHQSWPALPVIVLGLPRGGPQPNDKRYPIAVLRDPRYRGLLTSDSTRIPGLVSIVDVARTALGREERMRSTREDDPAGALTELEDRIREHRDAKTPMLVALFALILWAAIFQRRAVLPIFAAVLLTNLALGITGWSDASIFVLAAFATAAVGLARLPLAAHGLLLVGVLAAYLVAMGIDERWVALSPFGPTQNARFYGLSNLLATLLLVPALAGAAILARRFGMWALGAVAAIALVAVGGSQFGADGGGVVVLLVAYAVLVVLEHGVDRRMLIGGGVVIALLAAALAAGAGSHVTDALADGPAGLAEDLARRLELSWLRATAGVGVALLVGGGAVALAVLAARERRPLLLAYLAAIAVSLVVNDSPNDVVLAGLAGYLALSTAPGVARPAAARARPAAPAPTARSAPAATP